MRNLFRSLLVVAFATGAFAAAVTDVSHLTKSLCANKKDGNYPLGKCSPEYLTCTDGNVFPQRCEFGLFFNRGSQQCSVRKAVADCQVAFDCTERDDGIYSEGCSRSFWYCYGGIVASSSCQPGLYFNSDSETCGHMKDIKACEGKCDEKAPFGETCANHYFVCDNQIPQRLTCPVHHVYDDYHRECRKLSELPQCVLNHIHDQDNGGPISTLTDKHYGNKPTPPTPTGNNLRDNYPTYTPPTTTTSTIEGSGDEAIEIDFSNFTRMSRVEFENTDQIISAVMSRSGGTVHRFGDVNDTSDLIYYGGFPVDDGEDNSIESTAYSFCLDRSDGNYFVSCDSQFINCVNGAATVMKCPAELVFNQDLNSCGFLHDVVACADWQPSNVTVLFNVDPGFYQDAPMYNPFPQHFDDLHPFCRHRQTSGPVLNLLPCSPYFIACKNGIPVIGSCDNEFLFNEESQLCETPHETFCPGNVSANAEVVCDTVQTGNIFGDTLFKATCSEHSVRAFEPCADFYYVCHQQTFLRRSCPDGQSFDSSVGACVSQCGHVAENFNQLTGVSFDDFCVRLGPGKHALGCTSAYVQCSFNGTSTVHECDEGFVFNKDIKDCALYCEGTPVDPAMHDLGRPIVFSPKTEDHLSNREFNFCAGKNPGFYGVGCSNAFWACLEDGVRLLSRCAINFFFDEKTNSCVSSCEFSENVPNATTTPKPSIDDVDALKLVDPVVFCRQNGKGLHAVGCSNSFFSCDSDRSVLLSCPTGLLFNPKYDACTNDCGQINFNAIVSTTTTTSAPVPFGSCNINGPFPVSTKCLGVFLRCINGVQTEQRCPPGQVFNIHSRACAFSCDESASSTTIDNTLPTLTPTTTFTTTVPTITTTQPILPPWQGNAKPPSHYVPDGFSRNPVYVNYPRRFRPDDSDRFQGVFVPQRFRVPFTPNKIGGSVRVDAFNRADYPDIPRFVQSPYPHYRTVPPLTTTENPIDNSSISINDTVTSQRISYTFTDEELDDLSNDNVSVAEGSGQSAEDDMEPDTATLWRKKREIVKQCQYRRRTYNPSITLIKQYEAFPTVDCLAGKKSLGCTGAYLECVDEVPQVLSCPNGLIFDDLQNDCVSKRIGNVPSCSPTLAEEPQQILSRRKVVEKPDLEEPITDPRCTFGSQSAVATGYCLSEFLLCLTNGQSTRTFCINNHLFDHTIGECVPAPKCGRSIQDSQSLPLTSGSAKLRPVGPASPQCLGRKDGDAIPTGKCVSSFIRCYQGKAVRTSCPNVAEVFSVHEKVCVPKSKLSECRPLLSTSAKGVVAEPANFCTNQPDGFYRHPSSCQRIIQCFGHETYEHQPCEHNLAFDIARGICDYRRNVPGCEYSQDGQPRVENELTGFTDIACDEASHGAHIPNKSDCSAYFRCVWGRLEALQCPTGTVFNPTLSVCDYADQVPHCATA